MQQSNRKKEGSSHAGLIKMLFSNSEAVLVLALFALVCFFWGKSEYFMTFRNITNVLGQASIIMLLAAGVAVVLISGEVDISVGSIVAVVAIPLVVVMNMTGSLVLGIAAALLIGLVIGIVNGYLSIYLKINSLIVTLGTLFIMRGMVYYYTGKRPIADDIYLESFFEIGNGRLLGYIPYPAIIALMAILILIGLMHYTQFGRRIYAVGNNKEVARLAGFNVKWIKFICFIISAIFATIGGILLSSRLGSAVHVAGLGYEFQAIAAAVLGGVSLAGGIGRLAGVALGVLILSFISNGLGMLKAPTEWQLVITGLIIIIAVAIDEFKKRRV